MGVSGWPKLGRRTRLRTTVKDGMTEADVCSEARKCFRFSAPLRVEPVSLCSGATSVAHYQRNRLSFTSPLAFGPPLAFPTVCLVAPGT
jgi:hypothetical protein